jgi:hypothetical protein
MRAFLAGVFIHRHGLLLIVSRLQILAHADPALAGGSPLNEVMIGVFCKSRWRAEGFPAHFR